MDDKQRILYEMLLQARHAIFFGGAGVSTESGIPDFRSTDGLYHQQWQWPPEEILSRSFFDRRPEVFYEFYRKKMLYPSALPNAAHLALAQLEKAGRLHAVITQNIDGLHQAAGSRNVIELHGTVLSNHCNRCGRHFPLEAVSSGEGVPRCPCGGIIKPDVVLYEESLPQEALWRASDEFAHADLVLVGGTSLAVYPAAGFVRGYRGRLVIINKSPTPEDRRADLVIAGSIGAALSFVKEAFPV